MLFTEARFLLFFALVCGVHWALRRATWRKGWLLAASYAFYAGWDWRFLGLIALSTAVDYAAGLGLARRPGDRRWLALSLATNLGLLGAFKYFDFFASEAAELLARLGFHASPVLLDVGLPVGISFYTFQTLSYTIDVYRGRLEPTRDLLDFALFVGFFPQLVAGPIVRAVDFLPQLARDRRPSDVALRASLVLFLVGYVKKACVADNVAFLIDPVFADPGSWSAASCALALVLYGVQIYCDFSGYSDMAIATAGLLGYRLPLNFDFPYLASSVTQFWRRWHISLTAWFRDYLYVPLGGNRRGALRTAANLLCVFFLCGLWHGASWNYVLFGLLHGLYLALERILGRGRRDDGWNALGALWMLLAVTAAWALFRPPTLAASAELVAGLAGAAGAAGAELPPAAWALLAAFVAGHVAARALRDRRTLAGAPDWGFGFAYGGAAALALAFASAEYVPFVYFQF